MSDIKQFTNDKFKILNYFYEIKTSDNKVYITQQEVADELEISRATINKVVGELKNLGYLEQDGNHLGRYLITDKAVNIIKTFRSIEEK